MQIMLLVMSPSKTPFIVVFIQAHEHNILFACYSMKFRTFSNRRVYEISTGISCIMLIEALLCNKESCSIKIGFIIHTTIKF